MLALPAVIASSQSFRPWSSCSGTARFGSKPQSVSIWWPVNETRSHMSFSRITLHVALKLWKGMVTVQMMLSSWNSLSHKVYFHLVLVSFPSELVLRFWFGSKRMSGCKEEDERANWDGEDQIDGRGRRTNTFWLWREKVSGLILRFSFQVNIWVNQTLWYWVISYTFIQYLVY